MHGDVKAGVSWNGVVSRARSAWFALALAMVVAGCAGPKNADEALAQARKQVEAGNLEGAKREMDRALAAPALQGDRPRLFASWVQLLIEQGEAAVATQALLARSAQADDAVLVQVAYGPIADYYGTNQQWQALLDFAESLGTQSLSHDLAARVALDNVRARVELGDLQGALTRAPRVLEGPPAATARRAMRLLGDRMLRAGNREGVAELLSKMRVAGERQLEWAALAGVFDVAGAIASRQWDAAIANWQALAKLGIEPDTRDALAGLVESLAAAQEDARVDTLCAETLAMEPATSVQAEAAYRWLLQARRHGQTDAIASRLQRALETSLPPPFLLRLYREFVYDLLRGEQVAVANMALAMADALAPRLSQPADKAMLQTLQFDAAFIAEDYSRVFAMLDAGLPNRDADWHGMARNKILAHQALRAGNLDEAVARFKEFMGYVERTWKEPAPDPSTNLQYTREMALGFNARRIGDILLQQGATNRAEVSYAEARDYYDRALQNMDPASREYAHVTNELARMPAARQPAN